MSNGSTARCRPSGPTGASTPATPNAQRRLHPGSSTTTISAATPHSEATPPPTGCHQRDGRVQLELGPAPIDTDRRASRFLRPRGRPWVEAVEGGGGAGVVDLLGRGFRHRTQRRVVGDAVAVAVGGHGAGIAPPPGRPTLIH